MMVKVSKTKSVWHGIKKHSPKKTSPSITCNNTAPDLVNSKPISSVENYKTPKPHLEKVIRKKFGITPKTPKEPMQGGQSIILFISLRPKVRVEGEATSGKEKEKLLIKEKCDVTTGGTIGRPW